MRRAGGARRALVGTVVASVLVVVLAGCGDDADRAQDGGTPEEFCTAFDELTDSDPYADYEAALEDGDGALTDEAAGALRDGLDRIIALRALSPDEIREETNAYVRTHEEYAALIADLDGSSVEDAARIGTLQAEQLAAEEALVAATADLCA